MGDCATPSPTGPGVAPKTGAPAAPDSYSPNARMAPVGSGVAPSAGGSRRLWAIVAAAAIAVGGAFTLRAWLRRVRLARAAHAAHQALERDTYGGLRDADLALRAFIHPGSPEVHLALERAYALAELAARYGDDQAEVESQLLLRPIELSLDRGDIRLSSADVARLYAAKGLDALGDNAPGDAIVALAKATDDQATAELLEVQAQADRTLERPGLADTAIHRALALDGKGISVLHLAADLARAEGRPRDAAALYARILSRSPAHVPSLVALAELAAAGQAGDPAQAATAVQRSLSLLPSEGSPDEQCRALLALVRLDLRLGRPIDAPNHLDRAADLDDPPASCELDLARLDRRLGRRPRAVADLEKALDADDPGEAPLALAELTDDPRAALKLASTPPPPDLGLSQRNLWAARAAAAAIRADLALSDARAAFALAPQLAVDTVPARIGEARLKKARGESAAAARALASAAQLARVSKTPGDSLADVGEAALDLGAPETALSACDGAAAAAPGNCRALLCAARALHALGRDADAAARVAQALVIDPSAPVPAGLAGTPPAAGTAP